MRKIQVKYKTITCKAGSHTHYEMLKPSKRDKLMSELPYIPEHLMYVEAGTGLGSRTWQITMTDNPGTGKHLMKDGQQVSQPFSLGRRTGVARQPVLNLLN